MKLVSTFFGDAGSFALDVTGEFVVVQGNGWQFKKEIEKKIQSLPVKRAIYLAYLAILNSSLFSDLLPAVSTQVAGGQWDLSKRYVELIPIPDLFNVDLTSTLINKLVSLGEQGYDRQGAIDSEIRELLMPLYQFDVPT
jgi:hypothetical protein